MEKVVRNRKDNQSVSQKKHKTTTDQQPLLQQDLTEPVEPQLETHISLADQTEGAGENPEIIVVRESEQPAAQEEQSKWQKWFIRARSGSIMITGFFIIIALGHLAIVGLVFALQLLIFKELFDISYQQIKAKFSDSNAIASSRFWDWYLFFAFTYFNYGRVFFTRFPDYFQSRKITAFLMNYHTLICFAVYCFAFVGFVCSLQKGMYKRQFVQLAWTTTVIVVVVFETGLYLDLIFEGLAWVFLTWSLIVANDIFAFFFGVMFGRTPLIELSPKKTREGFIGATFATIGIAWLFGYLIPLYPFLTCPKEDFLTFSGICTPRSVFVWTEVQLPDLLAPISQLFGNSHNTLWMYPIQYHALVFGAFASIIAPFGGFFASGFKRAFKLKDFAETIPGHGGVSDRMDCQLTMAVFSYVYIYNVIFSHQTDLYSLYSSILALDDHQQLDLYHQLRELLLSKNLLTAA